MWTNNNLPNQTYPWSAVASNSAGTKLVACVPGSIWTSYNGTWTDNSVATPELSGKNWYGVASNSTGAKLVACVASGSIWTSNNGTWTDNSTINGNTALSGKAWVGVASDSTGTKLVACVSSGSIWTSNNGTWTDNSTINGNTALSGQVWRSVASDSTGTKLVACAQGGSIWTSNNGTWTDNSTINGNTALSGKNWYGVASDSMGTKLMACVATNGSIWTSNNGTWTDNSTINGNTALSGKNWYDVASDSTGTKLAACGSNGTAIWTSINGTWTNNSIATPAISSINFTSIASDTSGNFLIAAASNIWTFGTPIVCFKEDTFILTNQGYKRIQELCKGDLVQTLKHGYKPIAVIGKKEIYHEATSERIKEQLYKCPKQNYIELFDDLIITGCHCILVDRLNEHKEKTIEVLGKVYITDQKSRLPACVDPRTTVYEIPGTHTIYHLALENDNEYTNYGIYANGLLVESCSKRMLKEFSGMHLK